MQGWDESESELQQAAPLRREAPRAPDGPLPPWSGPNPWTEPQQAATPRSSPERLGRHSTLRYSDKADAWFSRQPERRAARYIHHDDHRDDDDNDERYEWSDPSAKPKPKPRKRPAYVLTEGVKFAAHSSCATVPGYNKAQQEAPVYVPFRFAVRAPVALLWRIDVAELTVTDAQGQPCGADAGSLVIELEQGRCGCEQFLSVPKRYELKLDGCQCVFYLPFNGQGRLSFNTPLGADCQAAVRLTVTTALPAH